MESKYVIFDHTEAVMFAATIAHKDVATMQHGASNGHWERKVPTSAGFFQLTVKNTVHGEAVDITTYGESESLGLKPDKMDAALIKIALGIRL